MVHEDIQSYWDDLDKRLRAGQVPEQQHLEVMIQAAQSLGPRPQSAFRANSKTIRMIGEELVDKTPVSRYASIPLIPPPIGTPESLSVLFGITIEVDETVPDGWVKPAFPKPSFDFTSMRLNIDPTSW